MNKMLSSWKEIAHFFGKGVRTVQRWEKTLDLPIRRPTGAPSNVVLARTSDLEEWMHRSVNQRELKAHGDLHPVALGAVLVELDAEVARLTHRRLNSNGTVEQDAIDTVKSEADAVVQLQGMVDELRGLDANLVVTATQLKKVA